MGLRTSDKHCECGCGELTDIAIKTSAREGWKQGEPLRFRPGHKGSRPLADCYDVDPASGCWVWKMFRDRDGYGVTGAWSGTVRKRVRAHRAMYEAEVGSIPEGAELDHLCRNPSCVNPAHLEPVTRAENARRSPLVTKLTWEYARWIFVTKGEITNREIAEMFGVTPGPVSAIRTGKIWKDVSEGCL